VSENDLRAWAADPVGTAERLFPGAREVIERFDVDVDVAEPPMRPTTAGWEQVGYAPSRHFGTWVDAVRRLGDDEVRSRRSSY
jgi:hypothetical protein